MAFAIGSVWHWKIVAWTFVGIAIFMIVAVAISLPESPTWLVQVGK